MQVQKVILSLALGSAAAFSPSIGSMRQQQTSVKVGREYDVIASSVTADIQSVVTVGGQGASTGGRVVGKLQVLMSNTGFRGVGDSDFSKTVVRPSGFLMDSTATVDNVGGKTVYKAVAERMKVGTNVAGAGVADSQLQAADANEDTLTYDEVKAVTSDGIVLSLPERAAQLEAHDQSRQVLVVRRVAAGAPSHELLQGGDLLLEVNGAVVTSFREVELAAQAEQIQVVVLRNGEEQVLSRWNMEKQKLTVSREQCKLTVSDDGIATLKSTGRSPTMWRSKHASEFPRGPWNALFKDKRHVLADGDQVSLDCHDPDDAVFTIRCQREDEYYANPAYAQPAQTHDDYVQTGQRHEDYVQHDQTHEAFAQQGQTQQRYAQGLPAGWIASVDNASGATYYYNVQTGLSQWEMPY